MLLRIFVLMMICVSAVIGQNNTAKQINLLMQQIRSGATVTVDKQSILASSAYKENAQLFAKYFSDTLFSIRYEALNLNTQLSLRSNDKSLVSKSIKGILDNAITKGQLNNQIVALLKKYAQTDFSAENLNQIKNILSTQENNIGALVKVYAFAGGPAVANEISNLSSKPALSKLDKGDIKLALVRCGDENLVAQMTAKLKEQVVNDNLIYYGLPEIIYTKNKSLLSFLLNSILSDDKKCTSANSDDNQAITCAYRLIENLAPEIIDFPATINERGEIASTDLNKTLVDVREWIKKNQNTFQVNMKRY
jgi:hypothetical protein